MSDLPPTIDAILASIRARVTGDAPAPAEVAPAQPEADPDEPPLPLATMALEDIGRVEITPEASAMTLDALIRQTLEPLLKSWLDANMPEIVEKLASEEIRRLTGKV